jgi:hypothetical protein
VTVRGCLRHSSSSSALSRVEAGARWAVSPAFQAEPDPEAVLQRAGDATQRYVQQAGRDTITESVLGDPAKAKWARAPQGETTCAFCLILASRGAVYLTRETAGAVNRYHNACDCQPTPSWDGSVPYDEDALYAVYNDARSGSGSGNIKDITAWLRANRGFS